MAPGDSFGAGLAAIGSVVLGQWWARKIKAVPFGTTQSPGYKFGYWLASLLRRKR